MVPEPDSGGQVRLESLTYLEFWRAIVNLGYLRRFFWVLGTRCVDYSIFSSRWACAGSSGSLARNFSNVRVAPVLPMVTTETVVVLLTRCADLRLVSEER
jgi:hypothetical protein